MEQLADLIIKVAGGQVWLAVVVPVLLVVVSEVLPFLKVIPGNGILHSVWLGVVELLQKLKGKVPPAA